jgi:hypothetical protein
MVSGQITMIVRNQFFVFFFNDVEKEVADDFIFPESDQLILSFLNNK